MASTLCALGVTVLHTGGMQTVARHKTAMSRSMLSRPMQHAYDDGLIEDGVSVFDYGCGRGDDIRLLRNLGHDATGWDPAHAPTNDKSPAQLVNLGYVINVIEKPTERVETLRAAWELTRSVLVVSARLTWDPDATSGKPFGDGRMTSTGTFQKYFEPEELKQWVEAVLDEKAVTAAPGILYVFRDPAAAQQLLARNSRASAQPKQGIADLLYALRSELLKPVEDFVEQNRRLPVPTEIECSSDVIEAFGSMRAAFAIIRSATGAQRWADIDLGSRKRSEQRFAEHLDELQPLIDFVSDRGRLPRDNELSNQSELEEIFGSPRAAFSLIRKVTGPERWVEVEEAARENFLVYSALAAFGGRPKFSDLPTDLQHDAKDLYGSYRNASEAADQLLYSIANLDAINEAINEAPFGKLTPEALYVHADYVNELPSLLRVYDGAARQITGDVDDATLIKFNRLKPQVSFLVYKNFEKDPHPSLEASIVSKLGEIRVKFRNFANSTNPPILHRKELFVPEHHPSRDKFDRLSRQEDRAELLGHDNIGTRDGWEAALTGQGYTLKGHRLTKAGA